jgi:hypothetical protein
MAYRDIIEATDDLILYLPLDEASDSDWYDVVGGRHFRVKEEPFTTTWEVDPATGPESGITLNTGPLSGDPATIFDVAPFETTWPMAIDASGEFTVETWCTDGNGIFLMGSRLSFKVVPGSNTLYAWWPDDATRPDSYFATWVAVPDLVGMHHWAITYDGTNLAFYYDGYLLRSVPAPPPVLHDEGDFSTYTYVGASQEGGVPVQLDDFALYARALTLVEIQAHCTDRGTLAVEEDLFAPTLDAFHDLVRASYPVFYIPAIEGEDPIDVEHDRIIDVDTEDGSGPGTRPATKYGLAQMFRVYAAADLGEAVFRHGYLTYEWVVFGEWRSSPWFVNFFDTESFDLRWIISGTTRPNVKLRWYPTSGDPEDYPGTWANDAWHHIVVQVDEHDQPTADNNLKVFIDTELVIELPLGGAGYFNPVTADPSFFGAPRFFDHVAMYAHHLDPAEIAARAALVADFPNPFDQNDRPAVGRLRI